MLTLLPPSGEFCRRSAVWTNKQIDEVRTQSETNKVGLLVLCGPMYKYVLRAIWAMF